MKEFILTFLLIMGISLFILFFINSALSIKESKEKGLILLCYSITMAIVSLFSFSLVLRYID